MYKNKATRAFTLGELMVWIAIIWILAIWVASIDFNRLSKNQESEIEIVKIMNIIEEVRNNALIWRGIDNGSGLIAPDSWSVVIDNSSSWSIDSIWTINWPTISTWSLSNWETKFPFEITNMECQTTDWNSIDTSTASIVSINYTWANAELVWCSTNSFKKLVFDYGLAGRTKEISINAVTGVIEIN
jgi:Tfp pilus assembly protein PilE